MKNLDFARHLPPGLPFREERNFFLTGLIGATLYSMLFFLRYLNALDSLYAYESVLEKRILIPDAVMPDFAELVAGYHYGFLLLSVCMMGVAAWHYLYHRRETHSIYLMRRLPDPLEYHRRCLTLPAVGILISLLAAGIVLLLYFAVYMLCTPDVCLTGGQWAKLWR